MNRSDFWFSGANEFNPNFSFSSSSTSRSAYGRARPRLTKLRKQKSSFLGQGAADLTCNPFRNEVNEGGRGKHAGVFGWRSDMGSVAGGKKWMPADGSTSGKEYDKLRVPNFSVTSSLDRTSTAQLPKEFDKLNVRENTAAWSGGVPFTCGNASYFEFKSSKDGDSHDTENSSGRSSAGVLPDQPNQLHSEETDRSTQVKHTAKNFVFKCSFSGLNGSTEAMLSERMEHVCIEDRVGDSNSGAARDSDHGDKENMFFRGDGVTIPTAVHTIMPSTSLENCGSRLCSSVAPSSSSSASNFRHETNFFMKTFGNRHNVNSSLNRKVKLVPKRHAGLEANLKKKRENAKHNMESRADPASRGQESVFKEFSFRPESPQPYSPMDMSPNPEITVKNQLSNGPGTSERTFTQDDKFEFSGRNTQDGNHPLDEDLVFSTQQLNIGDNVSGTSMHNTKGCAFEGVSETHPEELVSVTETESFKSATEDFNSENTTSAAVKKNSPSNSESDGSTNIYSIFNTEDTAGTNFTFAASSTTSGSASVRRFKTINRRKGFDSNRSTATSKVSNALSSGQHLEDSFQTHVKPNITVSQLKADVETNTSITEEVNHESSGTPAATTLSQEACEKWRLRGNEAYANGDPTKAEEYYTRGVRCIPKSEKSRGCLEALMLCYSNRAATRMYLGRLREAVKDCKLAAEIDPSFLKAHVRAANCYLALGEVEEASKHFKHCLHSGNGICVDRKIITEASEGLQKAQKAAEGISRSIESIQRGTCNDAEDALRSADKSLTVCLYSEKLLEIKAEALFVLQKYSKVIQLCQESLDSAKRNSNTAGVNGRFENPDGALLHGKLYFMLWRCRLMLKSYFFLGKLEEALALLEKHESFRRGSETLESLIPFVATIRELLRHKAAGNEAFKSGNYADAIEHYTAALSSNVDSRPFAAICFCNRAAAYKALGKFIDSIADCNLAIALERDYLKAISRRASLYESIRDCGQAARDTERIVSLLKEQANAGHKKSHETSANSDISIDLRQTQMQLSRLEEQGRKDIPLNMYLILGIKSSASAAEIKKAYRQAALKHHPDKAGQLLAKGDSGRNATWKEIAEEIRRDADRLFKMIGEAYTVLSDPAQRSGYDAEEEIRNVPKKSREPFTSRTHVDAHNYPFERSRGRWNNGWRTHGRY